jgi:type VI secretion system ImpM family protein
VTRARAILFGKLPRHGDFVSRGLTAEPRAAWDDWASGGLLRARETLGERFEDQHDAAPPWRFIGGPGVFGPGWRAGAIAPSIDSAGRRFVILLAAEDLSPGQADAAGEAIAEAMEGLIYDAFESGWDADALIDAAGSAVPVVDAPAEREPHVRWWTLGGPEYAARTISGQTLDAAHLILDADGPEALHG